MASIEGLADWLDTCGSGLTVPAAALVLVALGGARTPVEEFGSMDMELVVPVDSMQKDLEGIHSMDKGAGKLLGHMCRRFLTWEWNLAVSDSSLHSELEMADSNDRLRA